MLRTQGPGEIGAPREVHLRDYWKVIWQSRYTLLTVFLAVVALTVLKVQLSTPVYQAGLILEIRPEARRIIPGQEQWMGAEGSGWLSEEKYFNTQLEVLRSRDLAVAGYVKTHHRALLPAELHARVPELGTGDRTRIFALGQERYSCYMRLAAGAGRSPWYGITRLEVSQSGGLEQARLVCDQLATSLPRFAGRPHRDPRAPQNLQPIGALSVPFLGRTELIRNKRATARPKDLADLAALEGPHLTGR